MPTPPVIERLKELQIELETVSTAIKHIDNAADVAKSSSEILKKIPNLIVELRALEEKHREEFLKVHKDKIYALEKQLQELLTELKEKSKQLNQLINETAQLEKTITDYYSEIKKINFPERLDKIDNQISSINIGVGNLQSSIQNIQVKVDTVHSTLNSHSQLMESKFLELENRLLSEIRISIKNSKTNRFIIIIFGILMLLGLGFILYSIFIKHV